MMLTFMSRSPKRSISKGSLDGRSLDGAVQRLHDLVGDRLDQGFVVDAPDAGRRRGRCSTAWRRTECATAPRPRRLAASISAASGVKHRLDRRLVPARCRRSWDG